MFHTHHVYRYLLNRYSSFFFKDTAPTEIYTLSLHDALPISLADCATSVPLSPVTLTTKAGPRGSGDRKSTRLNSSHLAMSYAVFCFEEKVCVRVQAVARERAAPPTGHCLWRASR